MEENSGQDLSWFSGVAPPLLVAINRGRMEIHSGNEKGNRSRADAEGRCVSTAAGIGIGCADRGSK
jgi:hypothetical protein